MKQIDRCQGLQRRNIAGARHHDVGLAAAVVELVGDLYVPDGLARGEKRAGIVLCHGYTGVRNIYLPDNARLLNGASGFCVLKLNSINAVGVMLNFAATDCQLSPSTTLYRMLADGT
jgi:hypothetical protein